MEPGFFRTALFAQVTRTWDDFLRGVATAVARSEPYATQRAAASTEFDEAIGFVAKVTFSALAQERQLTDDDCARLTSIGFRRAQQAFTRDQVATGVRAAMSAGQTTLMDLARTLAAERNAPGEVVAEVLWDIQTRHATLEIQIVDSLAAGLDRHLLTVATCANDDSTLVDALIKGLLADDLPLIEAASRGLGVGLEEPCSLLLFVARRSDSDALLKATAAFCDTVPHAHAGEPQRSDPLAHATVLTTMSPEGAPVVAAAAARVAEDFGLHVLCYETVSTVHAVVRPYRQATFDYRLPAAVALPPAAVSSRELSTYRLLASARLDERVDLAEQVIGRLSREGEPDLIDTLETAYRVGTNQPALAKALGVHVNTIARRLARIEQLCEVDLELPSDALQLFLALRSRGCVNR